MVEVVLPNKYSGKDLVDAVEEAGLDMGYKVYKISNSQYVPGSVHEIEAAREVILTKPEERTLKDALRAIFPHASNTKTSLYFFAKIRKKYTSINVSVFVKGDYDEVKCTSSRPFEQYKAEFEKFVEALYTALKQEKACSNKKLISKPFY